MFLIIFILIIVVCVFYIKQNKIHIQFYTFLKKGFKKNDDTYGLVCFSR